MISSGGKIPAILKGSSIYRLSTDLFNIYAIIEPSNIYIYMYICLLPPFDNC